MSFNHRVERWRPLAEQECQRVKTDLSPNVVLAVIRQESNGTPGAVAKVQAGDGSYASGLMQTLASVLSTYNSNNGTNYTPADLTGKTVAAAAIQVRVGLWLLLHYHGKVIRWFSNHSHSLSMADRIRFGDVAYAMGPGKSGGKRGLIPKLETLEAEGGPMTWAKFEERFESWGYSNKKERWINRPIHHANTTYRRSSTVEAETPYPESYGGTVAPPPDSIGPQKPPGPDLIPYTGAVVAVLVIVGIVVLMVLTD